MDRHNASGCGHRSPPVSRRRRKDGQSNEQDHYAAYGADRDPEQGVTQEMVNAQLGREPDDKRTGRVLAELVHTGYLEAIAEVMQTVGPVLCRLTEKGLQHTPAGWPVSAADEMYARIVAELERRIVDAPDEKERSRLEKLRDGFVEFGPDFPANFLGSLGAGAVHGAG